MQAGREGRYVAAEAKAGTGITGDMRGGDYVLGVPPAPHFLTRFTLLSPDLALKRADVSLFGVPLGRLSAVHRRVLVLVRFTY